MLPEEREDLPLGGGPAQKRGAIAVARSLSPIASAILLALIAVLLGASAPAPLSLWPLASWEISLPLCYLF